VSGLLAATAFLTVFGRGQRPTAAAVRWFPVVGALFGAALGVAWWLAEQAWPAPVAAAIVVVLDLGITGMLHLDGLTDAADGLLPHLPRERRLEVMSTPDVGAFGVGVAMATLLLRFAALACLGPSVLQLAALWAASRSGMALVLSVRPYARTTGLADAFRDVDRQTATIAVVSLLGAVVLASVWSFPAGLVALVVAGAAGASVIALAQRRLGGYTGDVLGAMGVLVETVGLVVASARW
jgi:adenosylcobinamide-GDP ribazoletransferase